MPQTYDMVALEDLTLMDGAAISKGRRFTTDLRQAAILKYHQKARHATEADPVETPTTRRRYRRRDLQAEP